MKHSAGLEGCLHLANNYKTFWKGTPLAGGILEGYGGFDSVCTSQESLENLKTIELRIPPRVDDVNYNLCVRKWSLFGRKTRRRL